MAARVVQPDEEVDRQFDWIKQPIDLIFVFLVHRIKVEIWLYDNDYLRILGYIIGFDEYMNVVLDYPEEHYIKKKVIRRKRRMMLKGDNIALIKEAHLRVQSERYVATIECVLRGLGPGNRLMQDLDFIRCQRAEQYIRE